MVQILLESWHPNLRDAKGESPALSSCFTESQSLLAAVSISDPLHEGEPVGWTGNCILLHASWQVSPASFCFQVYVSQRKALPSKHTICPYMPSLFIPSELGSLDLVFPLIVHPMPPQDNQSLSEVLGSSLPVCSLGCSGRSLPVWLMARINLTSWCRL